MISELFTLYRNLSFLATWRSDQALLKDAKCGSIAPIGPGLTVGSGAHRVGTMKVFGKSALLVAVAGVFFVAGFGVRHSARWLRGLLPGQESEQGSGEVLFVKDGGFWHRRKDVVHGTLAELNALAYVAGSQSPSQHTGVTIHDPARSAEGVNLYSSAHAPQAFLIDATGRVLHQWRKRRDSVWPGLAGIDEGKARQYFRRLHLFENGDLLAIFEYTGIIRLDAQSNLLWSHQGWNHHHLDLDRDGKIYVLGRDFDEQGRQSLESEGSPLVPRKVNGAWVLDEYIAVLSPQGELLEKISLLDCIENSRFAPLIDFVRPSRSSDPIDLLHSNTLQILDGQQADVSPLFKEGNVLVSLRNISTIAIIDPKEKTVVWALSNAWRRQHDPVLLASGKMLLFDNHAALVNASSEERFSQIIEFDPFTQQVAWSYHGEDGNRLFSSLMGTNQRLANGNTLITESDFGRVLEVTPGGEIVWEFKNPHTTGEQDEFVAVIPELIRLSADFPLGFAAALTN